MPIRNNIKELLSEGVISSKDETIFLITLYCKDIFKENKKQ